MLDYENLKKYSVPRYNDAIVRCEHSLSTLQDFYNNLETADFSFIQQQLLEYLHTDLYEELNASLGNDTFPLVTYIACLERKYHRYKKFLQENWKPEIIHFLRT